jgi:hypothetical protein
MDAEGKALENRLFNLLFSIDQVRAASRGVINRIETVGRKRGIVIVRCGACGKELERAGWRVRRAKVSYCNVGCRNAVEAKGRQKGEGKKEAREDVRDRHGNGMVYLPDHKRKRKNGYVLKKDLAVEGMLGRGLKLGERVVVLNGEMDDLRQENLRVKVVGEVGLKTVREMRKGG